MALDLTKLQEFDPARLHELDRRVDDDLKHELDGRKRVIEESRAKKRKKAQKSRGRGEGGGGGGRS